MKKCNGCKRQLEEVQFTRKNKIHARCNDCSSKSSCKKNFCETCGIRASFNIQGLTWGRFCSIHKELGMVNVKDPTCKKDGCNSRPVFNFKGETKGLYCKTHKELGMVNVKDKTCEEDGCETRPYFNFKGENKGRFCVIHKKDCMVDVKNKSCLEENCDKQPIYNYEGEPKGIYCFLHKEDNMVNIKDKKCKEKGCDKIPNFNYEGKNKGLYCNIHKEDNMVNVKNKKCEKQGCKTQPAFNYEGELCGKFCEKHKENDMVNVIDRNRICEKENCKTRVHFGYCGTSPSHCAQHRLDYMIIKPKRTCEGNDEEDCKDVAIYGKDEPMHCEEHKLQNEICWLVKRCSNCGRDKELLNKDNLCGICCDKPFYEESKRINKVKETIMVKYLRNNVDGNEILADRIIDSTCNLYRPDILYDCGTHIVVVECDENQHKNYPWESCSLNRSLEHMEEKRMYEIMVAYGLPAIFLRWNPDNFNIKGSIVKKYNNARRLEMLVKWVKYCMKLEVSSGAIYKKLFYDEYEEDEMSFKKIEETSLI